MNPELWRLFAQHYFGMCPVTGRPLQRRYVSLAGRDWKVTFDYANRVIEAGPMFCHCHGKILEASAVWTDAQVEDRLAIAATP